MKKFFALMLALAMVTSLAACGGQADSGKSDVSATQSQVDGSQSAAQSGDAAPVFDTGWASNDFEKLIPELPFEGWTVTEESERTYALEISGLNTSPATNTPGSGEADGADKTTLLEYLDSLTDYGFAVEETGEGYQWLVTDPGGNTVDFKCAEGFCWVTIRKAK